MKIDHILKRADQGEKLDAQARKILRDYLVSTGSSNVITPIVAERVHRIKTALGLPDVFEQKTLSDKAGIEEVYLYDYTQCSEQVWSLANALFQEAKKNIPPIYLNVGKEYVGQSCANEIGTEMLLSYQGKQAKMRLILWGHQTIPETIPIDWRMVGFSERGDIYAKPFFSIYLPEQPELAYLGNPAGLLSCLGISPFRIAHFPRNILKKLNPADPQWLQTWGFKNDEEADIENSFT